MSVKGIQGNLQKPRAMFSFIYCNNFDATGTTPQTFIQSNNPSGTAPYTDFFIGRVGGYTAYTLYFNVLGLGTYTSFDVVAGSNPYELGMSVPNICCPNFYSTSIQTITAMGWYVLSFGTYGSSLPGQLFDELHVAVYQPAVGSGITINFSKLLAVS